MTTNLHFYLMLIMLFSIITLITTTLRNKFTIFILNIVLSGIWGSLHNLDGMILILLTAEFTIVLLFLMTYMQLYSNYQFKLYSKTTVWILLLVGIVLSMTTQSTNFYFFTSFYRSVNHIVNSDFFILYYFLFELLPSLIIYITLIISFFSLFFILLYFNLKLVKNKEYTYSKQLFYLRKQNLLKQTNYNAKTFTFQN